MGDVADVPVIGKPASATAGSGRALRVTPVPASLDAPMYRRQHLVPESAASHRCGCAGQGSLVSASGHEAATPDNRPLDNRILCGIFPITMSPISDAEAAVPFANRWRSPCPHPCRPLGRHAARPPPRPREGLMYDLAAINPVDAVRPAKVAKVAKVSEAIDSADPFGPADVASRGRRWRDTPPDRRRVPRPGKGLTHHPTPASPVDAAHPAKVAKVAKVAEPGDSAGPFIPAHVANPALRWCDTPSSRCGTPRSRGSLTHPPASAQSAHPARPAKAARAANGLHP